MIPVSERAASLAMTHIVVTSTLLGLGLVMFLLRVWLRVRPVWRISWEDYVMAIGVVSWASLGLVRYDC